MTNERTPDWGEWRHFRTCKLWQLVALSLNIEPHTVKTQSGGWAPGSIHFPDVSEAFKKRLRVAENLASSIEPVAPALYTVTPRNFTEAIPADWELPQEWPWPRTAPEATEPAEQSGEELKRSERDSLLRLVLGMAMARYGYKPGERINEATGNKSGSIAADLETLGLRIDPKTVRDYLGKAKERYRTELERSSEPKGTPRER